MSAKWTLRWTGIALVAFLALCVSLPAWAADLATPTAIKATVTPAASPSPDNKPAGFVALKGAHRYAEGIQIGSANAAPLTFVSRSRCTFNLPSLAVVPTPAPTPATTFGMVPTVVKVGCTVTDAAVGDTVLTGALDVYDAGTLDYEALTVHRCKVTSANLVTCWLHFTGAAALDPGAITLDLVVVR